MPDVVDIQPLFSLCVVLCLMNYLTTQRVFKVRQDDGSWVVYHVLVCLTHRL